MLLAFILFYLGINLAIGWWASRRVKTTTDFVMAGRQLPLLVAGSALFATWFGSETILGASSEFVDHGLLGVIEDPFGAALCLLLVGAFYARPLYRLNLLTFNDFFRIRFGRRAELISALFMVPSYFGWIAAQLVAMAVVLQAVADVPFFWGVMLCSGVVVGYTYIGGMWAVSITDFVQTVLIVLGLAILAVQLWGETGGWEPLREATPPDFFRFLPEPNWHDSMHYLAAWITIGLGSIPQQDVFQRVMAARNSRTAVGSSFLGGMMYLTIGMLPLFIGLCSMVLYPGSQGDDPQLTLPRLVLEHSSLGLQVLFFGALLSAILSTTSGAVLAPATVIGENLVKPRFPWIKDRQLLRVMRLSVVLVAFCSAAMALWKSNIYDLVAQSSALSLVSLFVPLTAGLFWKRASHRAALASMLAGMVGWLLCEGLGTETPALIWGVLASALAMVAGSLFFADDSYGRFLNETRKPSRLAR